MSERSTIVIIVLAVLIAAGIFLWGEYGRFAGQLKNAYHAETASPSSSGGVVNPADAIPQTNPFSGGTNPIKNIYKNPFSK